MRNDFAVLGFGASLAIEGDFRGRPDDRDGSPQLVRGVGHELALLIDGAIEPVDQTR